MFRNLVAAAVAMFVFVGGLSAAEYKGKLTKVDGNKITVAVGAKKGEKPVEKTFTVASDAKFVALKAPAQKGEKPTEEALTDGLKNAAFTISGKGGPNVTIITDGEGDKETVKTVKVAAGAKKKDK
jgi:hypothetical protein